MDKKHLSERDICTKFITPTLVGAGWKLSQFREEVKLAEGRVIVRGKLAYRLQNPAIKGGPKRTDYVLYAKGNIPIAVIEAKRAVYELGHGMQQALDYAEMLDVPIAFKKKRILFLADRNILIDQIIQQDFAPFGEVMHKISNRTVKRCNRELRKAKDWLAV